MNLKRLSENENMLSSGERKEVETASRFSPFPGTFAYEEAAQGKGDSGMLYKASQSSPGGVSGGICRCPFPKLMLWAGSSEGQVGMHPREVI